MNTAEMMDVWCRVMLGGDGVNGVDADNVVDTPASEWLICTSFSSLSLLGGNLAVISVGIHLHNVLLVLLDTLTFSSFRHTVTFKSSEPIDAACMEGKRK